MFKLSDKLVILLIDRKGGLHIGRLVGVEGNGPVLTIVSGLMVAHDGGSVGFVVCESVYHNNL